ncbi:ACP S-malonyltransferase [Chromobacterium alticapitis]|uniref:Malonyl CoA-acyl carrier protein transacylase n=1 Tax=Chromobacterium alticapitis TaxID=2073169 RepID=A0A2S5DDU8_9NEIS|nr:ACP S-malonyltransferase [Chromobacterium alticapitis]POZ61209.1 [acyl-carrier-protein] S-malonyltransferase [Chromobacterium alticapitis]
MSVLVFPGQGSQFQGMGRRLFDEVTPFLENEQEVDRLLGYSVRQLCLADNDERLRQTRYTQPALYIVNALHYFQATAAGEHPAYLAGHSLGEYTALMAAGAFGLLDGLRLVKMRGELMAEATGGGMAAVLGLSAESVAHVLDEPALAAIDAANFNSPLQTVISGPADKIEQAEAHFLAAGAKRYARLPVSGAFHSRYMIRAADRFSDYLKGFSFRPLRLPVVSNVTGRPYPAGDPDKVIRAFLTAQITRPVLWQESIAWLRQAGERRFSEAGPGQVLSRLIADIEEALTAPSALTS